MNEPQPESRVGAVLLGVLVCAGSIKSHPLLSWVPGDLTLLVGVALAVAVVTTVLRSGFLPLGFWTPVLFALTTVTGVAHSTSAAGIDKAFSFYTLTLFGMCAAAIVLQTVRQRSAFLSTIGVIGVVVTILVLVAPGQPSDWSTVVTLPGTDTITTSRLILAGAIVMILRALLGRSRRLIRFAYLIVASVMLLTALNTGSRGPIVAAFAAVAVALLLSPAFGRRRLRSVLLVGGLACVGVALAAESGTAGLDRILSFLAGGTDTSSGARAYFWELSARAIPDHPFGAGWGYFGTIADTPTAIDSSAMYPHNSVLEITLEAGWFPGVVFVLIVAAAFIRYVRGATAPAPTAFLVMFIFALANSLVSGGLNDNRLLWVLIFTAFMFPRPAATPHSLISSPRTTVRA